ncbi:hypothetical protein NFC81_03965 [Salinispirillum sp. LH 10-3-1]|uniref:DUF5723 domain-containing protein n=1 Tax=Salinispirillum sp. LH 10-3-1 TaxID=2952525 RepID=A0AB38YIQ4_9GAMM
MQGCRQLIIFASMIWVGTSHGMDFDDFSFDDFSSVTGDFTTVSTPPSVRTVIEQRIDGQHDDALAGWSTRIKTELTQPLNAHVFFNLDGGLDLHWPTEWNGEDTDWVRTQGRIDKATLETSRDQWQASVGLQSLVWGKVEGAGAVDVASPQALSLGSDISGSKVAQFMLIGNWYRGNQQLGVFLTPKPGFSIDLGADADLTKIDLTDPSLPVLQNIGTAMAEAPPEFGLSALTQLGRLELSLYGARLVPDLPVIDSNTGDIFLDPYWLAGLSATYPLGNTLLKADLAYKNELVPAQANDGMLSALGEARDRLDAAVGLEHNHRRWGMFLTFVTLEAWLDNEGLSDDERLTGNLAASWQKAFVNDQLTTGLTAFTTLQRDTLVSIGTLGYDYSDAWNLGLSLTHYWANDGSPLAAQNGEVHYQATAAFSF